LMTALRIVGAAREQQEQREHKKPDHHAAFRREIIPFARSAAKIGVFASAVRPTLGARPGMTRDRRVGVADRASFVADSRPRAVSRFSRALSSRSVSFPRPFCRRYPCK
jgi:hypothetical protein